MKKKNSFLKSLIQAAKEYETGKMLRYDSEVEIDVLEYAGENYVFVCDYSESRGSAEPVKKICEASKIGYDEIADACDANGWAYCL